MNQVIGDPKFAGVTLDQVESAADLGALRLGLNGVNLHSYNSTQAGNSTKGRLRGDQPLYEWLVLRAREHGLAGATVLRGMEGFGAHSRLHTAKILRLSTDLPIIIEIVDTKDKIEAFLPAVDEAIKEGLATIEKVDIRFYRSGGD